MLTEFCKSFVGLYWLLSFFLPVFFILAFVSRLLFGEIRVDEPQMKMWRKDSPYGDPADTRTLHGHFVCMVGEQQITHPFIS